MTENENNPELNQRESAEKSLKLRSKPVRICLEVTNRCNLRCEMCAQSWRKFKFSDLSEKIVSKVMPFIPLTTDVSLFGWGEPFLNRNFFRIYRQVCKIPTRIFVLTNGMLLKEEYVREFVETRLAFLNVSLDGATAKTYNSIRCGADFDRVMKSIAMIEKVKKECRSDLPYTRLVCVVMKKNIEELPELVKLTAKFGIPEIKAIHMIVYNRKMENESLFCHQQLANDVFSRAQETGNNLGVKVNVPDKFDSSPKDMRHKPCFRAWEEFFVQCDGKVRGCNFLSRIMGDLNTDSVEEIWNNEAYREFRSIINTEKEWDDCRNCCHYRHVNVNNKLAHIKFEEKVPETLDTE